MSRLPLTPEQLDARAARRAELNAMTMDQLRQVLADAGGELPPPVFRSKTSLVGRIMLIEFIQEES